MDREKVIKGLESHGAGKSLWILCHNCPYCNEDISLERKNNECVADLMRDALLLLKKQEVVQCRDCKYFRIHEWDNFHKRIWPKDGDRWYECLHPDDDGEHGTRTRGPDWFCADGKQK